MYKTSDKKKLISPIYTRTPWILIRQLWEVRVSGVDWHPLTLKSQKAAISSPLVGPARTHLLEVDA